MPHPLHITGCVRDASSRFPNEADAHHWYYQLVCQDGSTQFQLCKGTKQTVKALCSNCAKEVIVYDLSLYPGASKIPGSQGFDSVRHPDGNDSYRVYVMYEYGELDDDQVFDPNGITWCQVFIENESGDLVKILDDETA